MTDSALYETDIVAWADRQVAELRRLEEAGITNTVDWANVIEEIERGAPDIPPGLPARCPFGWDDLSDVAFTYEMAIRRLYDGLKVPDESAHP